MSRIFRPPRLVEWLLVLVAGRESWFLLGDLREEYADMRSTTSRRRAMFWFWSQILRVGPRLALQRLRPLTGPPADSNDGEGSSARSWRPADWSAAGFIDIRQTVRAATRRPGFALLVAGTLGVGIAAVTLLTAIIQVSVLAPLSFPESERVLALETRMADLGWFGSSAPEFLEQRDLQSFERVAGYGNGVVTLGDSLSPRRESVAYATADLLPLLGRSPQLGRFFSAEEDQRGGPFAVVLSHRVWKRDFGGQADIIGSTTLINGRSTPVVGVMPENFAFPTSEAAAWLPWRLDLLDAPGGRGNHFLDVVGRLRSGVELGAARAELEVLTERSARLNPDHYSEGYQTRLRPFIDRVVGEARRPLWILVGAAFLLLVIATANVSTLLIGRAHARARDVSVRAALGASRLRANAPFLLEAWIGVLTGGVLGLLATAVGLRLLSRSDITALPRIDLLEMTPLTWLVGGALMVAAGSIATLSPIAASRAGGRFAGLDGRGVLGSRRVYRSQRVLMTSQVALAAALCMGAGLMVRTLASLHAIDTGISAESVLTLRVTPPPAVYGEAIETVRYHTRLLERVRAVPGVNAAATALNLPYGGRYNNQFTFQRVDDATKSIGDSPVATVQFVSSGYVAAAGLRLSLGRALAATDVADAPAVVIVNESMARRFWPDQSAVGQRMRVFNTGTPKPWMEVVGVVSDVHANGLGLAAPPIYYVPTTQAHVSTFFTPLERTLLVRTQAAPASLVGPIRRAIGEFDAATAISAVRPLATVVDTSVEEESVTLKVLGILAASALLLATIGIAATTGASVRMRRREIGIRRALGETSSTVATRVITSTLRYVLMGIMLGVVGSVGAGSLLASVIYGVRPWDPITIFGVSAVLALAAAAASALPALTAARTDPLETLRAE